MANKLKRSDVAQRYRVSTRTVERWEKDQKLGFPKSIRYGYRSPLYDLDELDAWDRTRADAQAKEIARKRAEAQAKAIAPANQAIDLDDLDLDDIIEKAAA